MSHNFFLTVLCFFLFVNCKTNKFESKFRKNDEKAEIVQIYLKEFDVYFLPDSCRSEMELDLLGMNGKLLIELLDCKGACNFKRVDFKGNLILKGSYNNSLDTLKRYSIGKSIIDDSREVTVLKYFQPLANGIWLHYENGKIKKTENFKQGISIKE